MEEYKAYAKNIRKQIVNNRNHQNALNVPLFKMMLVNEPDKEIRDTLEKINESLKTIPHLYSSTEFYNTIVVTRKNAYKNFVYLGINLSAKSESYRGNPTPNIKYGNCSEYAIISQIRIHLVNPNLLNLVISSVDELDHRANLVQIKDQFYIIDKWYNSEIRRITAENYCHAMPLDLLLLDDETLRKSEFLSQCQKTLCENDAQKLIVANRIVQSFADLDSNDYMLCRKLQGLIILIEKLKLREVTGIKNNPELFNQLEFMINLLDDILFKSNKVQFDELDFLALNSNVKDYINEIIDQATTLPFFTMSAFLNPLKQFIDSQDSAIPNTLYDSDVEDLELKLERI